MQLVEIHKEFYQKEVNRFGKTCTLQIAAVSMILISISSTSYGLLSTVGSLLSRVRNRSRELLVLTSMPQLIQTPALFVNSTNIMESRDGSSSREQTTWDEQD